MPYISEKEKEALDKSGPQSPGQLNFTLTKVIQFYLSRKGMSYTSFNDVIGALEACKLEFYRRVVTPYEENKMKENGDVYDIAPVPSNTLLTP